MTLFGTAGIRGPVADRVTPALALAVGQAAGGPGEPFVLGFDGRQTGPGLAAAMAAGLESVGSRVELVGRVPTPALAFASRGRRGVMLTASHNPPADNGIKLFRDGVEYDRAAERAVAATVEEMESTGQHSTADGVVSTRDLAPWSDWGVTERRPVLDRYRDAVVEYVRTVATGSTDRESALRPLDGLSVVVDCGTGVGGLATPQVLRALGADVVALNANVDGHVPARPSKPTPETLTDLSAFLADGEFDCGIAHDGDADRLVVCGADGDVVHEDTILAAVAIHYTETAEASDPVVVTTPNASARIDERVRELGGRVERVRLGALHEGVARERDRGGPDTEVVFAAEPWKHIHLAFGGWIDGVVSAGVVAALIADAGGVEALREPITERPYRKVSVSCPDAAKAPAMDRLEGALSEAFPTADLDTDYGVRLEFPDASWILVRPSGTEPYVRLYAESDDVDDLVASASAVVEAAIADVQ